VARRDTDLHLDLALDRIGDRWTLLVVHALMGGSRRFNELMADVEGIAPNILTKRLRQLEIDALVVSTPYSTKPVRLAYTLTEPGRELAAALASLSAWGARQTGDTRELPKHPTCGTPVETRLWCPTCNIWVETDAPAEPLDWA
jgi:DNA-binding HxlR family transcriptional regulator